MRRKWDELYSYDDYVARIGKLIRREYEVYPSRNDQNRKRADFQAATLQFHLRG
jgi:hypothetical protein